MNRRGIAVFLLGLGLLLGALVARNGTLALLSLPFVAYVAIALVNAPSARLPLSAERSVEMARDGDAALVRVTVRVRNENAHLGVVRISDALPDGIDISTGRASKTGSLRPGETMAMEYAFRAAAGRVRWKYVHITATEELRLFRTECDIPAAGEAVVLPRLRRFRPFPLRPERTLHSPGSVLGGRAGSGTDFWGVREYQPGDQMRRLDWGRVARHPGQLFTRENEQEEIADIGLVLDARSELNLRSGDRDLTRITVEAMSSLAEMFLRTGNRVGLILLRRVTGVVHPGYGKIQLHRILRALSDVRPYTEPSRSRLDGVPLRVFSTRALLIVMSPATGREWHLFARLRARGNEGLLVSPDPVELMRPEAVDAVGRLAWRAARVERRIELQQLAARGVRLIDWNVDTPLAPLVRRVLQQPRGHGGGVRR